MTTPKIIIATWSDGLYLLTGDTLTHELAGQSVRGLTSDGNGATLAIVGSHSLSRRAPGGAWDILAASNTELSCCLAVNGTIYVGTDDARLLRLNTGNGALDPIDPFDHVAGRDTWFAGSAIVNGQRVGPPLGIRSLAANSNGSILFANVHVGGIPRSLDGGSSWHPTIDIHTDVHEVRAHPINPDIVAAASAVGLCLSRDAGATWTIHHDGLHARHCSAVAFSGDDILLSASASPFASEGRIYRRPLHPDGFLAPGMPSWTDGITDTGCIAANGSFIAIADRSGNLYISDDCGQTWSSKTTKIPPPSGVLLCESLTEQKAVARAASSPAQTHSPVPAA